MDGLPRVVTSPMRLPALSIVTAEGAAPQHVAGDEWALRVQWLQVMLGWFSDTSAVIVNVTAAHFC